MPELHVVLDLWTRAGAVPTSTDDISALTQLVARDADSLLVAELDGQVVGTLIAAWDGWRGAMYRLAVLPEYRRCGIALQLVQAGEASLRQKGVRRAAAMVLREHEHALQFWHAAGYRRDEQLQRFKRDLSD
jgi:ribosomal protein S18 acetylase RimI-like enzyme